MLRKESGWGSDRKGGKGKVEKWRKDWKRRKRK